MNEIKQKSKRNRCARTDVTSSFVKQVRSQLALTQAELAKKLGISRVSITKYENGIDLPPGDIILHLQNLIKL